MDILQNHANTINLLLSTVPVIELQRLPRILVPTCSSHSARCADSRAFVGVQSREGNLSDLGEKQSQVSDVCRSPGPLTVLLSLRGCALCQCVPALATHTLLAEAGGQVRTRRFTDGTLSNFENLTNRQWPRQTPWKSSAKVIYTAILTFANQIGLGKGPSSSLAWSRGDRERRRMTSC